MSVRPSNVIVYPFTVCDVGAEMTPEMSEPDSGLGVAGDVGVSCCKQPERASKRLTSKVLTSSKVRLWRFTMYSQILRPIQSGLQRGHKSTGPGLDRSSERVRQGTSGWPGSRR